MCLNFNLSLVILKHKLIIKMLSTCSTNCGRYPPPPGVLPGLALPDDGGPCDIYKKAGRLLKIRVLLKTELVGCRVVVTPMTINVFSLNFLLTFLLHKQF